MDEPEGSSNNESENGEMKSRSYQIEIEEHAMKCNTIIYLPTGAGKTFIAVQIVKRLQNDIQLPYSLGGKRTMFLVNTIPLVYQHAKAFKELTALSVNTFTSQDKVDLWNREQWSLQLENTQVLIMTAQILLDMLLHGYITLDRINLLIFDECHRAVENHPMRLIMARFEDVPSDKAPKVIGLTATLINKNIKCSEVSNSIRSLEATFNAKICTSSLTDEIKNFSADPYELITSYPNCNMQSNILMYMDKKLLEMETILRTADNAVLCLETAKSEIAGLKNINHKDTYFKKLGRLLLTIRTLMDESGAYGVSLILLYMIVKLERLKLKCPVQLMPILQHIVNILTQSRSFIEENMADCVGYDKIHKYSSPKLLTLLNILKEYNSKGTHAKKVNKQTEPLCGIIFVQERAKSLLLNMFLKKVKQENPTDFGFLKHNYITGFNSNPFSDTRETLYEVKKNKIVLLEFHKGITNCLISTDILEEGFDLPRCNLVIRYDDIKSFRSYIQSKGRGRYGSASYVIMVPADQSTKFREQFRTFHSINDALNEELIGKTNRRKLPNDADLAVLYDSNLHNYKYKDANITLNSSLTLINRYCMSLPTDIFTESSPTWYQQDIDNHILIYLQLPINCPLKTMTKSPPVNDVKLGKQKAALEALRQLHLMGELNDNLLPKDKDELVTNEQNVNEYFSHWENVKGINSDATGATQIYNKKFPSCLNGVTSKSKNKHYFYLQYISFQPKENVIYEKNNNLFKMLQSKSTYGFLTYNKINKLTPFTLYASYSEVIVNIEVINIEIELNNVQLDLIKRFHLLVFIDVLEINQRFVAYDQTLGKNSYFVVPVYLCDQNTVVIDWKTLHDFKSIEKITEPSVDERRRMNVTKEMYSQCIIAPWYRHDNCRYVVVQVNDTMTPLSPFPNDQFKSFAHYFKERYGLSVNGSLEQPLLVVKSIGGKMNCLLPRAIALKSEENLSKKKLRDLLDLSAEDVSKNDEIILIPEFCTRFSFPGILWLKAIFLPSIIHRFTMLLQAEELRHIIVDNTKIGIKYLPPDFEWPLMKVDIFSLKFYQKLLAKSKQQMETSVEINEYISTLSSNEYTSLPVNASTNALMDFEISKNNIENDYPWESEMEPIDINRNINNITLIDIECYEKFVNEENKIKQPIPKINHTNLHPSLNKAICAPSYMYNERINILDLKISSTGPSPATILEALTIARSNDVFNLERYESLGDSFLKYATSMSIYKKFPKYNEGSLTSLKSKIVSNKNLQKAANKLDLAGRMKVKTFNGKMDWMLPSFCVPAFIEEMVEDNKISTAFQTIEIEREEMVSGIVSKENEKLISLTLSDKSQGNCDIRDCESYFGKISVRNKEISDCVEALLGIYLLDSGIEGANKILNWLCVLPPDEKLEKKSHMPNMKVPRDLIDRHLDHDLDKIENILGYKFKDPLLLLEALTHSSYGKNNLTECYQRLEFIGDAVLDFLITCYIFERNSTMDPGEITDLRSALVNNITFSCLTIRLGLHKFLLSSNVHLEQAIFKFASYQTERNHVIDESVLILLLENDCTLATSVDVPKVLGDIFESIAGAIYIDSNKSLKTVWKHFYQFMKKEIAQFSVNTPKQPVRRLYEKVHARPQFFPSVVLGDSKIMVPLKIDIKGKITFCYGVGTNKEYAKRSAAKVALKLLS